MSKYTDANGREWDLRITVYEIGKVLEATDGEINLANLANDNGSEADVSRKLSDDRLFVQVLHVLLDEQIADACVTDREFGTGHYGEFMEAAEDAFYKAMISFFRPRVRPMLEKTIELGRAYQDKIQARLERLINSGEMDTQMQKKLDAIDVILNQTISSSAGNLAESSELTQHT